mmetsp:Transcript_33004/g.72390  ORF Transcript_33004/g.72390 Transcript_33004/m.72390 type:complete len:134 (-) Transcript_33004:8-409(-)
MALTAHVSILRLVNKVRQRLDVPDPGSEEDVVGEYSREKLEGMTIPLLEGYATNSLEIAAREVRAAKTMTRSNGGGMAGWTPFAHSTLKSGRSLMNRLDLSSLVLRSKRRTDKRWKSLKLVLGLCMRKKRQRN